MNVCSWQLRRTNVIDVNPHHALILYFPRLQSLSDLLSAIRWSGTQFCRAKTTTIYWLKMSKKKSWLCGFPSIYWISSLINELFLLFPHPSPIDPALLNVGFIVLSHSRKNTLGNMLRFASRDVQYIKGLRSFDGSNKRRCLRSCSAEILRINTFVILNRTVVGRTKGHPRARVFTATRQGQKGQRIC